MKPCVLGVGGIGLHAAEQEAIQQLQPAGFILFARNIDTPEQTTNLVKQLRSLTHHNPLIMVDQEGGRVQRLGAPHWQQLPDAATIGSRFAALDHTASNALIAAWAQEVAQQLTGIGANCCAAPVLDIAYPDAHQVIGDRAYGTNPELVATIGKQIVAALISRAIIPVIKHIPGHGRASVDSHVTLGRIEADIQRLEQSDLIPFRALSKAPVGMTAHVIYTALDSQHPFTQSRRAITWLRDEVGFDGLLVSDCIHMQALCGSIPERAHASVDAGIDLVIDSHATPETWYRTYQGIQITAKARSRLDAALAICQHQAPVYDARLTKLLEGTCHTPQADPTSATAPRPATDTPQSSQKQTDANQ